MHDPTLAVALERLRAALSPAEWERRNSVADAQAALLDQVVRLTAGGASGLAAIREVLPGEPTSTWVHRLASYRRHGRDSLIDRRCPQDRPETLVTSEVRAFVRGLLRARPELNAPEVGSEVAEGLGVRLKPSTVRQMLHDLGLSRPVGRPTRAVVPEPLPLAGAELLKAVDLELGAVAALTRDLQAAMEALVPPPPEDGVRDDSGNRDEEGRFLPAYNEARARTEPELGEKFDSVRIRSAGKDLPGMRTANSSHASLFRKVLALMMLPCLTDAPRWSALRHWQGDFLQGLVGIAYQPATLDKFARELKYAGVSAAARESVAAFWIGADAAIADPAQAAVVLYGDARVKPLWTHHFSRSTAVTVLGKRVMPAITTVHLHSGCGTPLIYREFSGGASVPREIGAMLDAYDAEAGESTVRRLIVLDSESHAVWLFKELDGAKRLFLIPLRSSSTGPNARFEEVSPWVAYRDDEACSGWLTVNDSRPGEAPLRVRVVGRRRHRTGSVAWYATNAPAEEFDDARLLDLYFARWPLQEHVFRDGNGRVGLGAHHGYGKRKVDNVAVLDEIEKIDGTLRKLAVRRIGIVEQSRVTSLNLEQERASLTMFDTEIARLTAVAEDAVRLGRSLADARRHLNVLDGLRATRRTAGERCAQLAAGLEKHTSDITAAERREAELTARREHISAHRTIFTVDTELDEIISAFKLTFLCLSKQLMKRYLGIHMEIDTLIRGVLTLPGERVMTTGVETIRIFRQPRDRDLMPAVEEACRLLTARGLRRDKRVVRFELIDRPGQ